MVFYVPRSGKHLLGPHWMSDDAEGRCGERWSCASNRAKGAFGDWTQGELATSKPSQGSPPISFFFVTSASPARSQDMKPRIMSFGFTTNSNAGPGAAQVPPRLCLGPGAIRSPAEYVVPEGGIKRGEGSTGYVYPFRTFVTSF